MVARSTPNRLAINMTLSPSVKVEGALTAFEAPLLARLRFTGRSRRPSPSGFRRR